MFETLLDLIGKGATSYVFSPKGKPSDGKSKVKPAPLEVSDISVLITCVFSQRLNYPHNQAMH
jgi:hypothetical protein